MGKNKLDIPLSNQSKGALPEYGAGAARVFAFGVVSALITLVATQNPYTVTWESYWAVAQYSVALPLLLIFSMMLFSYVRSGLKTKLNIYAENALDHDRSIRLSQILDDFRSLSPVGIEVTEDVINSEGEWIPFDVKDYLSSSVRESVRSAGMGNMFVKGITTPNLLDSSAVVKLVRRDDYRDTLRVLIPSSLATKEMIAKMIENHAKSVKHNTHTGEVINKFALNEECFDTLSHPKIIDRLHANLGVDLNDRVSVKVRGKLIKEGVVLATALEIDNHQHVFLPSGYIEQLNTRMAYMLGGEISLNIADAIATPELGPIKETTEVKFLPDDDMNKAPGRPLFSEVFIEENDAFPKRSHSAIS